MHHCNKGDTHFSFLQLYTFKVITVILFRAFGAGAEKGFDRGKKEEIENFYIVNLSKRVSN